VVTADFVINAAGDMAGATGAAGATGKDDDTTAPTEVVAEAATTLGPVLTLLAGTARMEVVVATMVLAMGAAVAITGWPEVVEAFAATLVLVLGAEVVPVVASQGR
jgi:hypothetical protein